MNAPIAGTAPTTAIPPAAPAAGTTPPVTPPADKPVAPEGFIAIADHQAALEKARKEEKDKLYADLQSARTQVESLTAQNATLTGEKTNLSTALESLKSSVDLNKKVDVQKLVEEVTLRAAKSVADSAQTQITTLQNQVAELTRQRDAANLKDTRDKLIAEAGGPDAIIPELVKGNTEAELRESIASSKAILERSLKSRGITTPPPAGNQVPNGSNPPAAPAAPAGGEVPPVTPPPIDTGSSTLRPLNTPGSGSRLNPTEWKSVRDAKLREAQGRYPAR